jgi:hypothetical protein
VTRKTWAIISTTVCPLNSIFLDYLINAQFSKNIVQHKMWGLIYSTSFGSDISHTTYNWANYGEKCILVFMSSARYSYPILIKLEFPQLIFEKYWNIKIHEYPSSASWVVPRGHTDGRTEGQSDTTEIIIDFGNFAKAPKTSRLLKTGIFGYWNRTYCEKDIRTKGALAFLSKRLSLCRNGNALFQTI